MPQKLGQHFLTNGSVLDRIALAVCPEGEELVIEIGPGKGALTEKLLKRSGRVIAIELDAVLVEYLRQKFEGETRLQVIHADVLHTDLAQWGPVPIAGNLPYYITSPILEKSVRAGAPRTVFLIQKEVAHRLVAHSGRARLRLSHAADRALRRYETAVRGEAGRVQASAESGFGGGDADAARARLRHRRPRGLPEIPQPQLPAEAQDAAQ